MSENKRQKVKKQHYVPRCYLEQWAKSDTHQVYVYDLKTNKPRISNGLFDLLSRKKLSINGIIIHPTIDEISEYMS